MKTLTQGQRKTILYLSLLLASCLLVAFTERMTGDHFVGLHSICFIAVIAGNAAEHIAKRGMPVP